MAGFDNDPTCQYTYERNNEVYYHLQNIREVNGEEIIDLYDDNATRFWLVTHLVSHFLGCDLKWVKEIIMTKNTIFLYNMAD